ncbi:phage GP46 family protein [Brytella acorum]|uniref:Phage GP46 family protein n=1 Tax=Brytella acorum TaxID=2959299 RepID=A0AA35UVH7_9PROT|nr:phage GP46 family protein [Brytella acorum]CAI9120457.1 phage GP46 family protein [Brytella acorum]
MSASACTIKMGMNPRLSIIDLAIDPIGNGRGRIAIDRTLATPLMIALGSDRRAEPDDVVPEMLTAPPGTAAPLLSRRGFPGDVLLSDGERYGCRMWLLSRAGNTETTRVAAAGYGAEAVAPIESYHGVTIDVVASWYDRARGVLQVTATQSGQSVGTRVTVL